MILKLLNILLSKKRTALTEEGRGIKARIEALGVPRMWGKVPPDILRDTQVWQQKCADAGLSAAAVFQKWGEDAEHTGASEVLLVVDETILALDPPGSMGG